MNVLKKKGFFGNTVEGTPEYEALVEKARQKLKERKLGQKTQSSSNNTIKSPEPKEQNSDAIKIAEELKIEGNNQLASGRFEEAISSYTKAIELVNDNAIYYSNRSAAYYKLGKYDACISDAKKSIEIDPKYIKAYSRLGLVYFTLENFQESVTWYQKALEMEPDSQITKGCLASAKKKLNETNPSSVNPSENTSNSTGFSNILNNLMGSAGGGSAPDFSNIMSNPQFLQMAQQMSQSPQFQQMAQQISSNPSLLQNLGNLFQAPAGSSPSSPPPPPPPQNQDTDDIL